MLLSRSSVHELLSSYFWIHALLLHWRKSTYVCVRTMLDKVWNTKEICIRLKLYLIFSPSSSCNDAAVISFRLFQICKIWRQYYFFCVIRGYLKNAANNRLSNLFSSSYSFLTFLSYFKGLKGAWSVNSLQNRTWMKKSAEVM